MNFIPRENGTQDNFPVDIASIYEIGFSFDNSIFIQILQCVELAEVKAKPYCAENKYSMNLT